MHTKTRNLVIAGALAAGVLGGGTIASAQTATTDPATTQTTPAPDAATGATTNPDQAPPPACDGQGPGGQESADRDAALAEKLGVSVDQVTAARTAARDAVDAQLGKPEKPAEAPTTAPTDAERQAHEADMKARHDLMEKTFAEKLGVSTEQLTAAQQALATEHVNADLAAGKITQDQADTMLQHIANGDLPEHGPHGPGGPGGPGRQGSPDAATAPGS
jgi:hypothetical protein